MAQQLPVANLLDYLDLKWSILQWVGCKAEQHRQHVCLLTYSEFGHLVTFAQQLMEEGRGPTPPLFAVLTANLLKMAAYREMRGQCGQYCY